MDCLVCKKSLASHINNDCFSLSLDNIKLHYDYIKNILQKRDSELQQIQKHNEHLNKLLQSSQEDQSCRKRVKKDEKFSWDQGECNTDISVAEDEVFNGPNLNMALNSEQLFETSILSPIVNNVSRTSSELVTSPRVPVPSKRNKQQENVHRFNGKNEKILERSSSLWQSKEQSKVLPTKSWATKFLQPKVPPTKTANPEKSKQISKKSDKKLSLSLTKTNVSKIKQTILDNYNTKLSDSTFCDDIIEASPVLEKSSKTSRSWLLQRSGHGLNNNFNITGKDKENKEKQLPIEEIFFDFSPTKKSDASMIVPSTTTKTNFKEMPSQRKDSSSVIMLTPATQDIIFVDDICDENTTNIDTMELLADLKQNATNSFKHLKKYESKSIEKYQNQGKREEPKLHQENKKHIKVPKPGCLIKLEKITQIEKDDDGRSKENVTPLDNNLNDEEEEEDVMPKPIKVKQEINEEAGKKINIKEKFNIDCAECEKFINFFGDHLSVEDIETHINQCVVHNREKFNITPENFWHPHILSFPKDDPRRKILIDTRLRDKNC